MAITDQDNDPLQGIIQALANQQMQQDQLVRMMQGVGSLGDPHIAGVSTPAYMGGLTSGVAPTMPQLADPIGTRYGNKALGRRR